MNWNGLIHFSQNLAMSPISLYIQDTLWIIPVVQCIHILAITAIIGAVLMIDLRILELAYRSQTMTATARRFTPWIWIGFIIAACTGVVMITGEPVRELVNPAFWSKMTLIAISLVSAGLFQLTLHRNVAFWEQTSSKRKLTRVLAVISLLIWCAVLIFGRWIAYAQVPVDA